MQPRTFMASQQVPIQEESVHALQSHPVQDNTLCNPELGCFPGYVPRVEAAPLLKLERATSESVGETTSVNQRVQLSGFGLILLFLFWYGIFLWFSP